MAVEKFAQWYYNESAARRHSGFMPESILRIRFFGFRAGSGMTERE
jgi:hypothetical protein